MRRDDVGLFAPAIGAEGRVIAYGHYGRPVLVFPSQEGPRWQFEENGMVDAVRWLIDAGRAKLYCVDSFDSQSWHDTSLDLEGRALRHHLYEDWIVNQVVPFVYDDCRGAQDILVTGCSFGAYHAANICLRRADLFPHALCMSGVYDASVVGGGHRGDAVYFNNPMDYVRNTHGPHLDWLRSQVFLLLVCGQGMWEETTGALVSTTAFGAVLHDKAIPHELDLWGHDVPHDWPSWRRQIAHHLPRFA